MVLPTILSTVGRTYKHTRVQIFCAGCAHTPHHMLRAPESRAVHTRYTHAPLPPRAVFCRCLPPHYGDVTHVRTTAHQELASPRTRSVFLIWFFCRAFSCLYLPRVAHPLHCCLNTAAPACCRCCAAPRLPGDRASFDPCGYRVRYRTPYLLRIFSVLRRTRTCAPRTAGFAAAERTWRAAFASTTRTYLPLDRFLLQTHIRKNTRLLVHTFVCLRFPHIPSHYCSRTRRTVHTTLVAVTGSACRSARFVLYGLDALLPTLQHRRCCIHSTAGCCSFARHLRYPYHYPSSGLPICSRTTLPPQLPLTTAHHSAVG